VHWSSSDSLESQELLIKGLKVNKYLEKGKRKFLESSRG
jgi:hypothetical protein